MMVSYNNISYPLEASCPVEKTEKWIIDMCIVMKQGKAEVGGTGGKEGTKGTPGNMFEGPEARAITRT